MYDNEDHPILSSDVIDFRPPQNVVHPESPATSIPFREPMSLTYMTTEVKLRDFKTMRFN